MCIVTMKTLTAALRGSRALNFAGVDSEVISLDATLTKNGCAYGISYPCSESLRTEKILRANKISFGEMIGAGDRR